MRRTSRARTHAHTVRRLLTSLSRATRCGRFYGVVFASKGTLQLEKIYAEAKQSVDTSLKDFDTLFRLLREAKCPSV